jgi:adenine phosphoribosyltransferase
MSTSLAERVAATLRDVPDFPSPGILFKDITPVLADPRLMRDITEALAAPFAGAGITHVVGVESRGFLFGMPLALALDCAFAPARKPGKLPWQTEREAYALEYRSDVLEMHRDALHVGAAADARPRVLVIDDVLATGGTAAATCRLVERLGGDVVAVGVLVELGFLNGRAALGARAVEAILTY